MDSAFSTDDQSSSRGAKEATRAARSLDAVEVLEADHRRIERLFTQFERCRTRDGKAMLADKICAAIAMHALLEEEMFYPAFLAESGDFDMHHQMQVEHQTCADLAAQIDVADASDAHFDARVRVLRDVIRSHIREEERPGGMFAVARCSGMDLQLLGKKMKTRKYLIERGCLPSGTRFEQSRRRISSSSGDVGLGG